MSKDRSHLLYILEGSEQIRESFLPLLAVPSQATRKNLFWAAINTRCCTPAHIAVFGRNSFSAKSLFQVSCSAF